MEFSFNNKKQADEQKVEWCSWNAGLKEEGDSFSITASRISFKVKEDETPVFYVFDDTDEEKTIGISVFCTNHPNSPYQDATPHGVRLARSIGRWAKAEGTLTGQDLCDLVNAEGNLTITVEKTPKGVLWSIA